MRTDKPLLSDKQWNKMAPLLPQPQPSAKGGRPFADNRQVVEGLLWMLRSGARWCDLPPQYPSPSTCWRRLRDWEEAGVWLRVWHTFIEELDEAGHLEWEETFADGSFAPAKKGALESGAPRKAKEPSGWGWSMAKEFLWHPHWAARRRQR
jgi:transposase